MAIRQVFASAFCTTCEVHLRSAAAARKHVVTKPAHYVCLEYTIEDLAAREERRRLLKQVLDKFASN